MERDGPWHLPVMGWLALVWSALGAVDYLLTKLEVPAYLALFSEAQVAYFTGLPAWLDALWAIAVWAGVAGAISLVARVRAAAVFLGIATVAILLATLGLVFVTTPQMRVVTGPLGVWIMLGSTVVYALFWVYARVQHAGGRLP